MLGFTQDAKPVDRDVNVTKAALGRSNTPLMIRKLNSAARHGDLLSGQQCHAIGHRKVERAS